LTVFFHVCNWLIQWWDTQLWSLEKSNLDVIFQTLTALVWVEAVDGQPQSQLIVELAVALGHRPLVDPVETIWGFQQNEVPRHPA